MKESLVPIYGGSYAYYFDVSRQRTVNLLPENVEDAQGKTTAILVSTNGTKKVVELDEFPGDDPIRCRGLVTIPVSLGGGEVMVGVWGDEVWKIIPGENPVTTLIGHVNLKPTPVSIAYDEVRVMIADGTSLWCFNFKDSDGTFLEDSVIPHTFHAVNLAWDDLMINPDFVVSIGHRFVVNRGGTGEFYYSKLLSEEFGASEFYTAETNIDNITALAVREANLHVFGSNSCEIWTINQSETEYDPFSWIGGSQADIGCTAPWTISSQNGVIRFLGASNSGKNTVFSWTTGKPERISNNAMENDLNEEDQNAKGFSWYEKGHSFYALQNSGRTWVWDDSTSLWHERSRRLPNGVDVKWECDFSTTCRNVSYFGSCDTDWLLKTEENRWVDFEDNQIVRVRATGTNWDDLDFISVRQLYLDCETGTTPELVGQGKEPWVMLKISRDGGCTWDDCSWAPLGRQGEFWRHCFWRNLGRGKSFIFEFSFSDPCPIVLRAMRITYEKCAY